MPYFAAQRSHVPCSTCIQRYLERGGRALARDFSNIPERDQDRWAEAMDQTREEMGCDTPWRGKKAVTYHHFIISPDPRDRIDLDCLRDLARLWASTYFGEDGRAGELGCYEYAIVYHDDNKRRTTSGLAGVPHAHIVVSNANLAYGEPGLAGRYRRLQIPDEYNEVIMPNAVQEIGEAFGLTYFDNPSTIEEKRQRGCGKAAGSRPRAELAREHARVSPVEDGGRFTTKEERAIIRKGGFSWKQDICNHIQIARRISTDEASFLEALRDMRVGVRERGDDWVFTHPSNPERWTCSGYRLGRNYTREALNAAMAADADMGCPRIEEVRTNVIADLMERYDIKLEVVAVTRRGEDIHDVAGTLRTIDRFGVRCHADFARLITLYEVRSEQVQGDEAELARCEGNLRELREAQACSARGNYFLGVRDTGRVPVPPGTAQAGLGDVRERQAAFRKRQQRAAQGRSPSGSRPPQDGNRSRGRQV